MKTELKYRTFDQLLGEVITDFTMFNTEGMIEPGQLLKVAQRVNYDLGLRIHGTKEKVLEIENRKMKLPDDFYVLNYAKLCGEFTVTDPVLHGRHTENVIMDDYTCPKCDTKQGCECEATYVQECRTGEKIYVQVIEKRKQEIRTYKQFVDIKIVATKGKTDALDNSFPTAFIKNGFIYTNLENGKVFISYQGALEDDDGNLLVLDHPVINEYYEYALKQRILENLYINGEDVVQRLQLIEQRMRPARNNALSIVNTPDFEEMQQLWETNRKAQYYKYYDMFKSYGGL
jgi:hypothetical protein